MEWATTHTACTLMRIPALRMKRRLNAHAAREWEEIVQTWEEAKQTRVADERRSCELRFGRLGRRASVASVASERSMGGLSRDGSSAGGVSRVGSISVRRRASVLRRGSMTVREADSNRLRTELVDPTVMISPTSLESGEAIPERGVGRLERTGTIELSRYGVSIPMQYLPDSWAKERTWWRDHTFEGQCLSLWDVCVKDVRTMCKFQHQLLRCAAA